LVDALANITMHYGLAQSRAKGRRRNFACNPEKMMKRKITKRGVFRS
jgi:hypothetical protein